MGLWDGNLRNSPLDIAIDFVLLIAIVVSYIPQIARIVSNGSTQGISPYFVLFNAIYSNIQFANALLFAACAYPTDREPVLVLIGDGRLRGLAAFGALLGLLQVALQWACSIALVMLFAAYPFSGRSPDLLASRKSIAATAFVHAALFLFPAIAITLPKPSPREFGPDIFIGFSMIVNTWVALVFVIFQFYPQHLEMRRMSGAPGALSLLSLGLQASVVIAIALRWLLRLGSPTWGDQTAPPWSWYQWGELPFSYILHAVGCAILLAAYLIVGRGGGVLGTASEETPLLA